MPELTSKLIFLILMFLTLANHAYADSSENVLQEVKAREILSKIEKGEPIKLDHVRVPDDLDLSKLALPTKYLRKKITTKNFIIDSRSSVIITSRMEITSSTFDGLVDFSGAHFNETIALSGSTFKGEASFGGCTFGSDADFSGVAFNDTANFGFATFRGYSDYHNAKFDEWAGFTGATFTDVDIKFAAFNGTADFTDATFGKYTSFGASTFQEDAKFLDSAFEGYADFRLAKFEGDANFDGTTFDKEAQFSTAVFNGSASFEGSQFKDDAFFAKTNFNWKLSLNQTSYNKLYVEWLNIKDALIYNDAAYMSLMKNFKDLGYYEDYDSCYFQYRKEHRSQPWPAVDDWEERARKLIDYPLELFYGYGTKPFNAFLFSLGIVTIFASFWWAMGLGGPKDRTQAGLQPGEEWLDGDITDILGFSVTVFLSGTRFFIDPPALPRIEGRSRSLMKKAFILERLLGALFSVLFFIAIGGTIVRAS